MPEFPPLAAVALPADAVEVGRIAEAWGVKGWFKVHAHSSHPEALFAAREWFLQPAERGAKTFADTRVLALRQVRPHSDSIVASAEGVDDRSSAELLRGARIFIARSYFPQTEDGEYYWVDLIGLAVIWNCARAAWSCRRRSCTASTSGFGSKPRASNRC